MTEVDFSEAVRIRAPVDSFDGASRKERIECHPTLPTVIRIHSRRMDIRAHISVSLHGPLRFHGARGDDLLQGVLCRGLSGSLGGQRKLQQKHSSPDLEALWRFDVEGGFQNGGYNMSIVDTDRSAPPMLRRDPSWVGF